MSVLRVNLGPRIPPREDVATPPGELRAHRLVAASILPASASLVS